jgi:hypothetical protein
MGQTWVDLLFIHWPIQPALLRSLIPQPFEIDTFDGVGWIGVVPFGMIDIHFRGLPPLPLFSNFLELNVRTYVRWRDKAGVYFFSLDAENFVAVEVARSQFSLPYFAAKMRKEKRNDAIDYSSERIDRRGEKAIFEASYRPTSNVYVSQSGTLANWLTERYCFLAINHSSQPVVGEIHHRPWPLQNADAEIRQNTYIKALGLDLETQERPVLHYSSRLETIEWSTSRLV